MALINMYPSIFLDFESKYCFEEDQIFWERVTGLKLGLASWLADCKFGRGADFVKFALGRVAKKGPFL